MTNVVVYSTGRPDTTQLLFGFARGLAGKPNLNVEFAEIEEYKSQGLRTDADCIVILGILRGPGLVFKECRRRGIDFIYLDHAYFNSGYENGWMRVVKNAHTMSSISDADAGRFQSYFAADYPMDAWPDSPLPSDAPIIVLPPTHATCWLFDDFDWLERTCDMIRKHTHREIVVRPKPLEPRVDEEGNLLGLFENPSADTPLSEDLKRAHCAVIYNSNSAIDAIRWGVPLIATEHCPGHAISFGFDQIESEAFLVEPERVRLFNWLAWNQFQFQELIEGTGWDPFFPE